MAIDFSQRKFLNSDSTKSLRTCTFNKNEVIVAEGDTGQVMYEILEGTVGVYVNYRKENETFICTKKAGEYFGEIALVEDRPRTATIIAMDSDTVLREISVNGFIHYVKEKPEVLKPITDAMAQRYKDQRKQYIECCRDLAEYIDCEKNNKPKSRDLTQRIKKYIADAKSAEN